MEERLGDRIRALRERVGMTGAELARRVHITSQQLYMIETHRTLDPGVLTVEAIADEFGVTTDYLLKGKRNPRQKQDNTGDMAPAAAALVGA